MSQIKIGSGRNQKLFVGTFFVVFLFVGLLIFKDYGLSWDEFSSRHIGFLYLKYAWTGDLELFDYQFRYFGGYGPVFEMSLSIVELIFNLSSDLRAVFLMRHLATFLLFYTAVIFFYRFCQLRFQNWKMSLFGCLLLVVSPRIFADSFYNSKDIPFMCAFILSMYSLMFYVRKRDFTSAVFHGFICAFAAAVRFPGFSCAFFTTFFLLRTHFRERKPGHLKVAGSLFTFLLLFSIFTLLFWPLLRSDTIHQLVKIVHFPKDYPIETNVFFLGKSMPASAMPWFYLPLYLLVTIPLSYTIGFAAGCFHLLRKYLEKPAKSWHLIDQIVPLWFFVPAIPAMIFKAAFYDGWRHYFFIYPAYVVIALLGFQEMGWLLRKISSPIFQKTLSFIWVVLVSANIGGTISFMARSHPYQNVYFNRMAGRNLTEAKEKFELDYWGLSYRNVLEHLTAGVSPNAPVKIYAANPAGKTSAAILKKDERERIRFVDRLEEADYFITNFRADTVDHSSFKEYYSVRVDQTSIAAAYQLHHPK